MSRPNARRERAAEEVVEPAQGDLTATMEAAASPETPAAAPPADPASPVPPAPPAAMPRAVRLVSMHGFYDEDGQLRMWHPGTVVEDPAEVALLIERGAPVENEV